MPRTLVPAEMQASGQALHPVSLQALVAGQKERLS